MRNPQWESSPGALVSFLNSSTQTYMVDLYQFVLSGGSLLRYTGGDQAVTINGITWSIGPSISRGSTKLTVGISVDTLDVSLSADSTVQVNGVALLPFIAAGGLDGARLNLRRAFSAAPGSAWIGYVAMFIGRVADVEIDRSTAKLTIKSDSELLNTKVPRNVYQYGCTNTLFDSACGLSKAALSAAATATSTTDAARTTFSTGLAQAAGYFSQGFVVGVTGANAGVRRTIKNHAAGGALTVIAPWPQAVAVGDTFTAYPGCDKTQATCTAKFANLARFRGEPYIPTAEAVT